MKVKELSKEAKEKFVKATLERGSFLRRINVWPPSDIFYEEWLSNFVSLDDRYIASKILNSFLYYSKPMVAKLLHDAVGNAISLIAQKVHPSERGFYKKEVFYSYIPGENPNPTDSGLLFMRKLREALDISDHKTLMFDTLKDKLLKEGTKQRLLIVLCDDFMGSGNQCAKKKSGADVIRLFDSCGLVDYLDEGYDVLHTQGREWLIADMEDYLKVRGIAA